VILSKHRIKPKYEHHRSSIRADLWRKKLLFKAKTQSGNNSSGYRGDE